MPGTKVFMNDSWELRWNATMDGATVPHIYAVYPYASGTTVSSDGKISLVLPVEQAYYGGVSFARGANTMVSVTDNQSDKLLFKNVCGYVQFKLYGDGASVTSVTLRRESCVSALRRRGRPDRYAGFPD